MQAIVSIGPVHKPDGFSGGGVDIGIWIVSGWRAYQYVVSEYKVFEVVSQRGVADPGSGAGDAVVVMHENVAPDGNAAACGTLGKNNAAGVERRIVLNRQVLDAA